MTKVTIDTQASYSHSVTIGGKTYEWNAANKHTQELPDDVAVQLQLNDEVHIYSFEPQPNEQPASGGKKSKLPTGPLDTLSLDVSQPEEDAAIAATDTTPATNEDATPSPND